MTEPTPADIVAFWKSAGPERWWKRDDAFDAEIRERFAAVHGAAADGQCAGWAENAEGTLALILVLDQFSRNLFRNNTRAFAQDLEARSLADMALARGYDDQVDPELRTFFYMPFQHSEAIEDQDRSVALFNQWGNKEGREYAEIHRDVIRRFGRFPHRNPVLGRLTTPEEQAFLDNGGFRA